MTITEFLLARIAEDEAEARSVLVEFPDIASRPDYHWGVERHEEYAAQLTIGAGRVLAECEAKRRLVKLCDPYLVPAAATWEHEGLMSDVLCTLASVYADHPDYRDEWRP